MNPNACIPVFFAVDDAYAPYLSVALNSIVAHISPDRSYRAIVLYTTLKEENKKRIASAARDRFAIDFVPMQGGLESIQDRMSNRLRCDYFTLTIYFRLFIPLMFPQYDKGIYIDSDVILNADLAELFDTDIGDNLIGACNDRSIMEIPELVDYVENAVGVPKQTYINSGVLLMNLKKLRQVSLEERFLTLLNQYHFNSVAPDQDYINAMCHGHIFYLDEGWDAMPNENHPELAAPKLIHYNLFSKPWCYDGVQYANYFWNFAKVSPYYEDIVRFKKEYDDTKKEEDSNCLKLLVERASEIVSDEITFKKMHETGVEIRLC